METYCSENINELALALIEVQKQMAPATKDGKNPFIGNNYATLNSVMESCRDILLAHGIWLTQLPVPAPLELGPGYLGLMTKLTHAESGQWQSSLTVIPLPKADPQGMGSAITYARRYALTAMLGMITEDDDAEAAKIPPRNQAGSRNANQNSRQIAKASKQVEENAECWFWKDIKWYDCFPKDFPDVDFVEKGMIDADEEDYYFIRIGEDYVDNIVRGLWWDNPFGISFCREIVLDC